MTNSILRAGILGAGFISEYHLKAIFRQPYAELVAVCDLNKPAAEKLAAQSPGAIVYTDLAKMLEHESLDVVHILTQPDSHYALARMVIEAGCHAIIEKPVTVSSEQAKELAAIANQKGRAIGINHNFVFSRPFNALQKILQNGQLGPIKSIRVVWKKMLPQINFGPWNLWMLREPGNILFETGSHSLSELLAILDNVEIVSVEPRLPKFLPSGSQFFRRWSIAAISESISIHIDMSFDQGYDQHFVEVEGLFGVAKVDMENDIFTVEQPSGRGFDLDRLHVNMRGGLSRFKQAFRTYGSYASSKFMKSFSGGPYDTSMFNGIANCYAEIFNQAARKESSIEFAIQIAKVAERIQADMPKPRKSTKIDLPVIPDIVAEPTLNAKILIIGASGFIGKQLLLSLQGKKKGVRALVRNASSLVGVKLAGNCEIMEGDYRNEAIIEKALEGIDVVIHLAVAQSNSLPGYLVEDSDPTIALAKRCQKHNIKRFIYTGTIDSLNLAKAGAIRESDGVDDKITRRNNYAHSKAITESRLNALYRDEQFPVVIIRPAIVLGVGGPVTHGGVANWFGLGHCNLWGKGENSIPIVLIEDVVKGLNSAISAEDIDGKTYNLSAKPCLSARDYVAEVEKVLDCKINVHSSNAVKHFIGDFIKWTIKMMVGHPDKARIPSIHDWRCREQHASFDTSQAQKDLNWQPLNNREAIIDRGIHQPTRLYLEA